MHDTVLTWSLKLKSLKLTLSKTPKIISVFISCHQTGLNDILMTSPNGTAVVKLNCQNQLHVDINVI